MNNILMISPDYPPNSFGGIGGYVQGLSEALFSQGRTVTVIVIRCDRYVSTACRHVNQNGVDIFLFDEEVECPHYFDGGFTSRWLANSMGAMPEIRNIVKNRAVSFIHCHDLFGAVVVDALRDVLQVPIVSTIHGMSAPVTLFEDGARRYSCLASHKVTTVSKYLAEALQDRYGLTQAIDVIPVGIENKQHDTPKCNMITFAGRLIHDKGADRLLEAVGRLKASGELGDYQVMIMGEGTQRKALEQCVQDQGLQNCVTFTGYLPRDEVLKRLESARIHVVPSRFGEPFGMSALEGMINGAFVLVANKGGLPEFVEHNKNGIVFDTVGDLVKGLYRAMKDQAFYQTCVTNGYAVAEKYAWQNIAQSFMHLYDALEGKPYQSNRIR